MSTRFSLPDASVYDFGDEFLVVCPRCQGRAVVRDRRVSAHPPPPVMLSCSQCGYSHGDDGTTRHIGDAIDWYFGAPLWLQTSCCGETLWAYNLRHLAFLQDFVQATLRENVKSEYGWHNQSLRNRLPRWIKSAHNREEILKCLARLRQKAEG